MTILAANCAMPIAMSSTLPERCLASHRQQTHIVSVARSRIKSKSSCNERCKERPSLLCRKPQHLCQRSHQRAGKVVCGYQRTAIAPPRGGTFPLPIDYTQVQSICHADRLQESIAIFLCKKRIAIRCVLGVVCVQVTQHDRL